MQHLDTDIDLALDDPDVQLVYEATGWNHLVHRSATAVIIPAIVAVFADYTGRERLLNACLAAAVLLIALAVFGLVMEYRADQRPITAGGHGE